MNVQIIVFHEVVLRKQLQTSEIKCSCKQHQIMIFSCLCVLVIFTCKF